MAQQEINIGTGNNTGDGEGLRSAFDKCNDNFSELYSINTTHGWGYYQDGETSPATQSITTTASYIQIDGLGANSNTDYLPIGVSALWDVANDKITPENIGDAYTVRLDFEITGKTGSPTLLDLTLDIGGTTSITIPIVERIISTSKTPPYKISVGFPIFCLSEFNTNGGRLFLTADTGTITIGARSISIYRINKGV